MEFELLAPKLVGVMSKYDDPQSVCVAFAFDAACGGKMPIEFWEYCSTNRVNELSLFKMVSHIFRKRLNTDLIGVHSSGTNKPNSKLGQLLTEGLMQQPMNRVLAATWPAQESGHLVTYYSFPTSNIITVFDTLRPNFLGLIKPDEMNTEWKRILTAHRWNIYTLGFLLDDATKV